MKRLQIQQRSNGFQRYLGRWVIALATVLMGGVTSPARAALIFTADSWESSSGVSGSSSQTLTRAELRAFVLFGSPAGAAQSLGHDITPRRSSEVLLSSHAPLKPVADSPTSAMLFVPALFGILGVLLCARVNAEGEPGTLNRSPATDRISILILSPDLVLAAGLKEPLHRAGYQVKVVSTVSDVLAVTVRTVPALVLLDHRVRDWDTLRTDSALRHVPLIALVPHGSPYPEEHCLSDLERGIDGVHDARDGHRLLVAKVGAYLRRAGYDTARRGSYQVGAVELDADMREVKVAGRRAQLSAKPFAILEALMRAPSKLFSRSELLDLVWGPQFAIGEHTLDVHVHALRQHLDRDPNRLCQLVTIKGVGFKLKAVPLSKPVVAPSMNPRILPIVARSAAGLNSTIRCQVSDRRPTLASSSTPSAAWLKRLPRRRTQSLRRAVPLRRHHHRVSVG